MVATTSLPFPRSFRVARRRGRASSSVVVTLLLALAMLIGGGSAASAHDELTGSSPAAGATVDVLPATLELTFSAIPSGIGAQVQVVDGSGTDWADGAVQIVDRTATQALRTGAPAGEYTVNWRVVSSDSHPIEGTYAFTTQQGTTAVPDSAGSAAPLVAEEERTNETQTAGMGDFPWSIALMIAALVAVAAVLVVTARRKLGAGKS